jgi:phosphatidylglycerol:prolipoprotein diacylglycerol transferase
MTNTFSIQSIGLHPYVLCLAISILISLAVLLNHLRRAKTSRNTGIIYALAAILMGIAGAKIFYALARFEYLYGVYGVEGLFRFKIGEFAFTGAILGVLTAAWFTARLTRQKTQAVINEVAASGMLLIALARFSEYYTDFGVGPYVYESSLHFFPFAVTNAYDEWYFAVFMLEGFVALAVFILLSIRKFPRNISKGDTALLLFSLTQVLLESFRSETLKWGFVRVQQLSSIVIAIVILAKYSLWLIRNNYPIKRLIMHTCIYLVCVALCVCVEFALDKTEIPRYISYLVMLVSLCVMGFITLAQMNQARVLRMKSTGESM